MEGHQVPQALVVEVGEVFECLLEETKKIRQEYPNDMSVSKAMDMVLERRPELRKTYYKVGMVLWCEVISLSSSPSLKVSTSVLIIE
jgi:polyamine oxidase